MIVRFALSGKAAFGTMLDVVLLFAFLDEDFNSSDSRVVTFTWAKDLNAKPRLWEWLNRIFPSNVAGRRLATPNRKTQTTPKPAKSLVPAPLCGGSLGSSDPGLMHFFLFAAR